MPRSLNSCFVVFPEHPSLGPDAICFATSLLTREGYRTFSLWETGSESTSNRLLSSAADRKIWRQGVRHSEKACVHQHLPPVHPGPFLHSRRPAQGLERDARRSGEDLGRETAQKEWIGFLVGSGDAKIHWEIRSPV